ncbi:hypothetical protein [Limihaloglobus sulfuriphilus]|uniref:hypothetical protein n=1 Tax=Limihaloglobus sulfuriphilus TaxID=1851148 RepID=UPI001649BCAB|nr:hypothetical protein [Limihaloglobus sulfuriphilus]
MGRIILLAALSFIAAAAAAETVLNYDLHAVSHKFMGIGAQIWSGDSSVEPLPADLKMGFVRLDPGPSWSSIGQAPPTDGLRSSFDKFVAENYSQARLSNMQASFEMLKRQNVQSIFVQFHVPDRWRDLYGKLRSDNHSDYAMLWGAVLNYLACHDIRADYIEMFNEPEGTWNCKVPPQDYNDILKLVRQELDERGFADVPIIGPGLAYLDHDDGGENWIGALDDDAVSSLGGFSTHAWDESFEPDCAPDFLRHRWTDFIDAVRAKDPSGTKPIFITEYMTGARFFHGEQYPSPGGGYSYSASDEPAFAARVFENSLSMLKGGANALLLWEAADQYWSDDGWGLQRRGSDGSTKRPAYFAVKTLFGQLPPESLVLAAPVQPQSGIYTAAFKHLDKVYLAAVNGTEYEKTLSVEFAGTGDFVSSRGSAYINGTVSNGSILYALYGNRVEISLPCDTVLTVSLKRGDTDFGDFNGDGISDGEDLRIFAGGWLADVPDFDLDLNNDNKVSWEDFALIPGDWRLNE